ncbi:MAG TPA: hypothetical protein PKW06_05505 [Cyclobacteriaceae bacterium]|nr:hypothetical protein [Cyclobacteriaceae bacterium]MCB9236454.1 hypothetical protein [Flammeovirgaceae bacterium]MCB0499376.1 hypothetical protein [Cyclobacteriaceae bacterium]MCO5272227.1 hypothetical protein [Cyclobacteriaceae bacterium]MCW5902085.1 hypothetical protein [Cyclobacteriaceae bacterium]
MVLKIFKALWFLSLLGFMVVFMYIYANLPQRVVFGQGVDAAGLSRNTVFYLVLGVVALVNVLTFVVSRFYGSRNEPFSSWFFGQVMVLNFFFCTVLGYFDVLNSGERFDFQRIGIVIYGSIFLMVAWAIGWPVYTLSRKIVNKRTI